MNGHLLDSNVLSELRKGDRCDPSVARWFEACDGATLFLSVIVIGELRHGAFLRARRDPVAGDAITEWIDGLVAAYAHRVLPVDAPVADRWAELGVPDAVPVSDGLIAATALVHGLTVATRNIKDIARAGVAVVNPFEPD
ncbi:MAG: type II toxin-antitoxin system VapC family toxin [Myxococcota bacterium]